ncbi:MAG: DUF6320 domain-containing protein [Oscillospiraceae bacterium]|nr:DUF6320 domain-containing protein [Oscillospiraceae bacterium]
MKFCEKCTVEVRGDFEKCPLCQNTLTGENQNGYEIFPFVPLVIHKHSLLFRLLQLCSAVAVIGSFTVNWLLPQSGFWSLFVVAGVACVWLSLIFAVRKRHNLLKNLTYQATIVSVLSVLWDIFTGWHGWSVDFVIPITFVSVMVATAIIAQILKMQTETYIIYSFLLIIYGIIPVIFVLSGLNSVIYPSIICAACSLILFSALLIFEGKNMTEELKRRLHL